MRPHQCRFSLTTNHQLVKSERLRIPSASVSLALGNLDLG
jgi:hypothetical protein